MLDDITYETAPKPLDVVFVGYNVYRNGKKLNAQPLVTPEYTDGNATGSDTYYVTVVYDRGESEASNIVSTGNPSGIKEVLTGTGNGDTYTLGGIKTEKASAPGVYIRNGKKFVKSTSAK